MHWSKKYYCTIISLLGIADLFCNFPVYLGMPLIFTDFQQSTWLRLTSCWKFCEYQGHPGKYPM